MRTEVLVDISDITHLEEDWERLRRETGGHVLESFRWILEWYKHFSEVARPRVIMMEHGGRIVAIAPLAYQSKTVMSVPIRTLCTAGWVGGTHEMQSVGLMCGDVGETGRDALFKVLLRTGWNNLEFYGLPDDALTAELHTRLKAMFPTDDIVRVPRPIISLEGVGEIISTFSERSRRSTRKALRTLGEEKRLGFRLLTAPDDAMGAMREYIEMHKARWASRGGSIFSDEAQSSFLLDTARMMAERSCGAVYQALIDGKIAAQAFTLLDGRQACVYRLGTNDDFLDYVPGYLLFNYLLSDLKEKNFRVVDLGTGAEDFKYRIGATDTHLLNLHAIRGTLAFASRVSRMKGIKRIADRTGLKGRALAPAHKGDGA